MLSVALLCASAISQGSNTPLITPGLSCPPSLFRAILRTDLVGVSLSDAPLAVSSEGACRIACCGAPGCDGYAFAFTELRFGDASCVLLANVSVTAPHNFAVSGLRMGVALPNPPASASPAGTPLPAGGWPQRGGSVSPTQTPSFTASASMPSQWNSTIFSITDLFPVMNSTNVQYWRAVSSPLIPAPPGVGEMAVIRGQGVFICDEATWIFGEPQGWGGGLRGTVSIVFPGNGCVGGFPVGWSTQPFRWPGHTEATLMLHPGAYANDRVQLQWTAPVSGPIRIQGLAYIVDAALNVGVSVLHNTQLLIRAVVSSHSVPFHFVINVTSGDVVTFALDYGDDGTWADDIAGLDATIVYQLPTPSPNLRGDLPYCLASQFRTLPRMDLVGTLIGTALSPGAPTLVSSLVNCRQACCDAPACDGFSFGTGDASFVSGGMASCFLSVNITQVIPNSAFSSGIYESTL